MRILLIGSAPAWAAKHHNAWVRYTAGALSRLGHRVDFFPYRPSWPALPKLGRLFKHPKLLQTRDRLLLRQARKRPDLVVVLKDLALDLEPELLLDLKRISRTPLVSWWVDDPFRKPGADQLARCFDHLFIFDRSYMRPLIDVGAKKVHFLPCACDETAYRPVRLSQAQRKQMACEVAFVAWFSPERARLVKTLAGELNVGVWGGGWKTPEALALLNGSSASIRGAVVTDSGACRIYNSAQVGLNIHHGQSKQGGLNTRTFELLAAGLTPLTDRVNGLEELLTPDKEVICYDSAGEALKKAKTLLSDSALRQQVAQAGRERVLSEHTYGHRMRKLLELSRG